MRYAFKPERSELKTTIKEMNVPVAFGISKAIKEKGFKQTYVAESAGYTPQELSDISVRGGERSVGQNKVLS